MRTGGLRRDLERPVSTSDALLALGLVAGWVGLQMAGAATAAWSLLAGAGLVSAAAGRLTLPRRSRAIASGRRPDAMRTHRVQETIKLKDSPARVWSLIQPAENAPLLSPQTARGYHVPGTSGGVGEQQASVALDGSVTVLEVVELTPERRAVTRLVSPVPPVPVRFVFELEPLPDGCLYTLRQEHDAGAAHGWSEEEAAVWRREARQHLQRVRDTLTTWQCTP